MRRAILIILAFVPALAAVVLFKSLDEEERPRIGQVDDQDEARTTFNEALAGFSGKGTFYLRLSPIILENERISYPSTYYLLDEWHRDENDEFLIVGLLVVRNEEPRTLADLKTSMLQISNSGSSADRGRQLEEARTRYDSLKAGKARASGGRTVADSDAFELSAGVEALLPGRDQQGPGLRIVSERARLGLAEGRLEFLELPVAFEADHPRYLLKGIGLLAIEASPDVTIASAPRIEARELPPGARRRIEAAGTLRWRPDALADGRAPDILDRVHLDFGEVEVEDDVLVVLDDIELRGHKATMRLGRPDGAMLGKMSSFTIEGAVVVDSPRGRVRGDRAEGQINEDGSMTLLVEGERSSVLWRPARDAQQDLFEASCSGPIRLRMPARDQRNLEPLRIAFNDEVVLDLNGQGKPVHLEAENLDVALSRVAVAREGAEPVEAWRFQEAILRGRAQGRARDFEVTSPRIEIRRQHDGGGLHIDDVITMEGPVHVERPGGLGRDDPELRSVIDARRRLELEIPASPFGDTKVTADGHVRVRENRGRKTERSLDCEHIEVVRGPETIEAGVDRDVLKSLIARDSVTASDEKGSTLQGDLVTWIRRTREGRVEGTPARASFVDARDRRQDLAAQTLEFNSASGKVVGSGNVVAKLYFPALRLADDKPKTDDERVNERPSLPWNMSCSSFVALFTGSLPLGDRPEGEPKEAAQLVEVDLEGDVKVDNPEQRILADALHYDLRRGAGSASGQPVKVRAMRELENGRRVEDWLEAESMLIEPDWTLLRGRSRALLHVAAEKQQAGRPKRYENLNVDAAKDVLLKQNELYFSGRTRLIRGVLAEGGLDVQADGITAVFAPAPDRKGGRGELRTVVGSGDVAIAWRDLRGEGQLLTVDYLEKKVVLEADPGGSCFLKRGRGYTARSEVVIYEMDSRKITQTKLRVEKRGAEGNK